MTILGGFNNHISVMRVVFPKVGGVRLGTRMVIEFFRIA